jgi:hypothetical protein
VQGAKRVEDSLGDLRQPLSNQNLLTHPRQPVADTNLIPGLIKAIFQLADNGIAQVIR